MISWVNCYLETLQILRLGDEFGWGKDIRR